MLIIFICLILNNICLYALFSGMMESILAIISVIFVNMIILLISSSKYSSKIILKYYFLEAHQNNEIEYDRNENIIIQYLRQVNILNPYESVHYITSKSKYKILIILDDTHFIISDSLSKFIDRVDIAEKVINIDICKHSGISFFNRILYMSIYFYKLFFRIVDVFTGICLGIAKILFTVISWLCMGRLFDGSIWELFSYHAIISPIIGIIYWLMSITDKIFDLLMFIELRILAFNGINAVLIH